MKISFNVNNGRKLIFEQEHHDGPVFVHHIDANGNEETDLENGLKVIYPGDVVMLNNLYWYIKENDIQNDFINPTGKNKED